MRILNSTTLYGWSAGSWYAVGMMAGMQRRGHDVLWLVPEGRTAERVRREGMRVLSAPDLRRAGPLAVPGILGALRRLLKDERPDLVIAHWGPDHAWWGMAAGGEGSPPLLRMRAHDPRPPAVHPFARWLQKTRTDGYVVANEPQRRAYVRRAGVPPERVHRIPPGFDIPTWTALDPTPPQKPDVSSAGTLTVASIARFAPQKDHEAFLAASALVAETAPDVRFLVAGYEAEYGEKRIRALAARHRALDGKLQIWSRRLAEGRGLVGQADIGVIHSRGSEAICRVAFEYMADGIPLIATQIGGLSEVIHEWETGLLVPPRQPEALAGAILKMVRSPALRSRLQKGAHRRLETAFGPEKAVDRLERVLERYAPVDAGR